MEATFSDVIVVEVPDPGNFVPAAGVLLLWMHEEINEEAERRVRGD